MPPAFKHDGPWRNANPSDREVRGSWWEAFGDPLLNDLVVRIDGANPTLEAALANRDRALAALREAGADRPRVNPLPIRAEQGKLATGLLKAALQPGALRVGRSSILFREACRSAPPRRGDLRRRATALRKRDRVPGFARHRAASPKRRRGCPPHASGGGH